MKMPGRLPSLHRVVPLSREGMVCFALAMAILLTGLIKGINLITLLACMFLAVGVLNVALAWWQVRGLRVERYVPDFLVAGTWMAWPVTVVQTSARRRNGLAIVEDWETWPATWVVNVPAATRETVQRWLVPQRRGVLRAGPAVVRSSYPFGLARFERTISEPTTLYVAPRLGRLQRGLLRRWLSNRQATAGAVRARPIRHPTGQMEFHGLRTFRPGDSPRLIHWRTSARRGELMVREFEEFPNDDLALIVDLSAPSANDDFERMLSLAATIVWEWCRQRGDRLTVVLVGRETVRIAGATGAAMRVEAMRAFAAAAAVERLPDAALEGELHAASTTAHLLLSLGPSRLMEPLQDSVGHVLAAVDVAAGGERDFFK